MARVSDNDLTRIKQDISLLRLVQAKGFKPKAHGKDYAMCCPFHDDDTASLIISPDKNLWHCMGACQTGGSVIDWVMKTEGVSFRHAVELLKNDLPHLSANTESDEPKIVKHNSTPKLSSLAVNPDSQAALRHVIDYYHEILKQSPEALEYLEQRGLKHSELIDRFKLGYANRTLAYRLPQKNRQAGAEIRGQLQDIGLLRDTGHEHFNGCLVIPVMDEHGVITEVYGRKLLGNRLRKGTAQHLYLPGPHHGVWNIEAVKASREVILCESLIDAMTFWVNGFRNVTASYGTAGFTSDHLAAFKQHNVERVLIAYDRDEAGNTAADKLTRKLTEHGIDCFRILFPKGMDANDYALKVQPANKSLGLAIRKAQWLGSGKQPNITTANALPTDDKAAKEKNSNDLSPLVAPGILPPATLAHPCASAANPLVAEEQPAEVITTPTTPTDDINADISEHEIKINIEDRGYRVRGLYKNLSYEQLKINLLVHLIADASDVQGRTNIAGAGSAGAMHVDTLDIYSARHRSAYIKQASYELGIKEEVIKCDLGKVLLKLEALQDQQIKGALALEKKGPTMTDEEVKAALGLLKDKHLLDRILQDFNRAGVVGEHTNKLVGYLAGVSRKLDKPLAVLIQSSSAAGKTSLMDAVLQMMPIEERVQYSAMTGQSLYYMGNQDLKHKILAIAEEEGAEHTSYALKLLQSEGEITIASTGKNNATGNLETQEYKVEGPVALFSTTTAIDIDEELLNRCIVLTVDESREQTQAIHAAQRKRRTLEGLHAKIDQEEALTIHANAQRLLRPLKIINPYADQLTFLDDKTRTRRDHEKYLGLIDAIALLHQYQRDVKRTNYKNQKTEYIEVTLEDIAVANRLAHDVLGRTLDELPPQTRRLLLLIHQQVKQHCQQQQIEQHAYRFSRKDVRALSGWTDFQVKKHMQRLEDLEYVLMHSGGRGKSIVYELLYHGEGQDHQPFLMGLIDVEQLKRQQQTKQQYDDQKEPLNKEKEPASSPQSAPKLRSSSTTENQANPVNTDVNEEEPQNTTKRTTKEKNNGASHRSYNDNNGFTPLAALVAKAVN